MWWSPKVAAAAAAANRSPKEAGINLFYLISLVKINYTITEPIGTKISYLLSPITRKKEASITIKPSSIRAEATEVRKLTPNELVEVESPKVAAAAAAGDRRHCRSQ